MKISTTVTSLRPKHQRAFTLIELLAVITIIGILAGLTVGVTSLVSRKSKESRTRAELAKIETAIRAYHSKFGFYPPDNLRDAVMLEVNPVINQLYYELTGGVLDDVNMEYRVGAERVSLLVYTNVFGAGNIGGIYNSSRSAANVENFLVDSRPQAIDHISESPHLDALVVPVDWPRNAPFPAPIPGEDVNPWRYVSSNPTNNPGEFDLWAEIVIGDELVVIGNWEEN